MNERPAVSAHRMWFRSVNVAGVIVAAIALTGCSALTALTRPASEPRALAAPPAVGKVIAGTGYAFTLPAGWDAPPDIPVEYMDLFAGNPTDADGFADNVNVVLAPANRIPLNWVEWINANQIIALGAEDVLVRHRVTVGGAETVHISALVDPDGLVYQTEHYVVSTAEQTYIVTFSFSPTVPVADRDALCHSVLASWDWI